MRPWILGALAGAVLIGLGAAAYQMGINEGEERAAGRPAAEQRQQRPAPAGPGRQLFTSRCGSCHVLEAAGTSGRVGPSMDDLRPDAQQVLAAIENGGAGSGQMPRNLLGGTQAMQVAEFVAATAGG